jgi:hypothetical protein
MRRTLIITAELIDRQDTRKEPRTGDLLAGRGYFTLRMVISMAPLHPCSGDQGTTALAVSRDR